MPHVSKRKLRHHEEKKMIDTLSLILRKINNDKSMDSFTSSLLSQTEQLMLAKRLAIVVLIKEGLSDLEISDRLSVTRETVVRIKMLLQLRGDGYKVALEKLSEEKRLSEFKNFLKSLARYSVRAAGGRI